MTLKIFKYPIDVGINDIAMPGPKDIVQGGWMEGLFIWVLVDIKKPMRNVVIDVVGTGFPIANNHKVYGSIITPGKFVWHITAEPRQFS